MILLATSIPDRIADSIDPKVGHHLHDDNGHTTSFELGLQDGVVISNFG